MTLGFVTTAMMIGATVMMIGATVRLWTSMDVPQDTDAAADEDTDTLPLSIGSD